MSHTTLTPTHPVLACATSIETALDEVVEADPLYLSVADKQTAMVALVRSLERVAELTARVLAVADDVAVEHGQRDAATWLAHATRHDLPRLRCLERLGKTLRDHTPTLAQATKTGEVSMEQAHVITRALHDLPTDLPEQTRVKAEEVLVGEAARLTPRSLGIAGHRILKVVDPDTAEEHDRKRLEDQERAAQRKGFVFYRRNGDGTTDLRIRLADAAAHRLLRYLQAYTNPRKNTPQPGPAQEGAEERAEERAEGPVEDRRPYAEKLATAFESFLEHTDPHRLPLHGGTATQIMITIDLHTLTTGLGTALLEGDQPISPGQVRRLACNAGITPVVLGTDSEILDLGRTTRLFTPAQRKALRITQPTCQAEGCDIPSTWCEAHHAGTPWATGGHTNLTDGLLLCTFHHHRAHDHRYTTTSTAGRLRFTRRT